MSETKSLGVALWDARILADKIEEALQESEGELTPELEDLLAFKEFTAKDLMASVDAMGMTIDRLDKIIEYYNEQYHALGLLRDGITKAKQKIGDNLKTQMESMGLVEINGEYKKISLRLNPPKVDILDEDRIPSRFVDVKVVTTIKKKEIAEALKKGEELNFARLVQDKSIRFTQAKKQIKGGDDE